MPDNRRRTPHGPRTRGGTGPGRATRGRSGARPVVAAAAPASPRPRLTGRAAILVLVLAVLAVSYASSMRAYLQQRSHIGDLKSQIVERKASIDDLEREKERWQDPAYVRAQARERFGYLMPGETPFVVLDELGRPLQSESSLTDPDTVAQEPPTAWYEEAWESMKIAGNPPRQATPPLSEIDGSDEPTGE
ncbi:MAG: septum formation initiator family protein [Nocardioides sp.]